MSDDLEIRSASADDVRFFWEVNNDPSVRAQSINTEPIPWEVHEAWFSASLNSAARYLFVVEVNGTAAGVVRFDRTDRAATISIALEPSFRGRGVGSQAIAAAASAIAEHADVGVVVAYVRPENVASLAAFGRAGFEVVEHDIEQDGVKLHRMVWEADR